MVLLAGFFSMTYFPPMLSYMPEVVDKPWQVGPATGLNTALGFAGSMLFPWFFGLMLDAGDSSRASYIVGYLMLAVFGAGCRRRHGLLQGAQEAGRAEGGRDSADGRPSRRRAAGRRVLVGAHVLRLASPSACAFWPSRRYPRRLGGARRLPAAGTSPPSARARLSSALPISQAAPTRSPRAQ